MRLVPRPLVGAAFVAVASASSVGVYEINSKSGRSGSSSHVSPAEAQLGLSELLGVSKYHELYVQGASDRKIQLLRDLTGSGGLFREDNDDFVVSLGGISHEDADKLRLPEALMVVDDAPGPAAFGKLLKELAEEKAKVSTTSLNEVFSLGQGYCVSTIRPASSPKHQSSDIDSQMVFDYQTDHIKAWEAGKTTDAITREMIETFTRAKTGDRQFVLEYLAFKAVTEQLRTQTGRSAFCHFPALEDLIHRHGKTSTQLELALSLYRGVLSHASTHTIVLLAPSSTSSRGFQTASHLWKRGAAETPLELHKPASEGASSKPTDSPAATKALGKLAQWYESEEKCNSGTNSCSSHGKCKETSKDKWSCRCTPTVTKTNDGKKKTIEWGGLACQKKDVSVPFNIFLIFTIVMVVLIASAIGLLFSIGSEELPSVLSAGVPPVKRA